MKSDNEIIMLANTANRQRYGQVNISEIKIKNYLTKEIKSSKHFA